ncbi:MAG: rod shape-determining protein MreC [Vulcanimicrobiota bacterium]
MLYTESMEMASPLLVREVIQPETNKQSLAEAVKNRMAKPRMDLGLCMGSDSFVVCTGSDSVVHPARVAVREHNGQLVSLGAQAAEIEGREPEGVKVVRPITAGIVSDPKLSARLMARAIASAKHGLVSQPRVALAVPAGLTAVESQALLATAKRAGVRAVYLVDQALAAAIGAGRDLLKAEGHLVVHVGAGVSQVTVSSLAAPVLSRALRVAGDTMSEALREHIRREHNLLIDFKVAEAVKKELGSALPPVANREMKIVGRELGVGKPVEKTVNSTEVYEVLRPFLAQIAQEARWVVGQMPAELLSDVHRNGVILSGGMARLYRFEEYLSQEIRLRVIVPKEPGAVVTRGLQALLNTSALRKAVFGSRKKAPHEPAGEPASERRTTGLLGALLLTSALAFAANSAPQLQHGASSTLDHYLSGMVTPAAPLGEGWGWHQPDAADAENIEQRRRDQLEQENARLRSLLNAPKKGTQAAGTSHLVADVVARDPRGWMSTLTLNVGAKQGVQKGMTVSDGTNLVGQVSRVQNDRCQVRLFTDSKAVVAGKLQDRKTAGVVVGKGDHTVEMRYLDPDAGVKKGDWVVTSGHDGVFPPGIRLGRVAQLKQDAEKNYLAATIRPSVDVSNLENVVVLKS